MFYYLIQNSITDGVVKNGDNCKKQSVELLFPIFKKVFFFKGNSY